MFLPISVEVSALLEGKRTKRAALRQKGKRYTEDFAKKLNLAKELQRRIDRENQQKSNQLLATQSQLSTSFRQTLKSEVDSLTADILFTENEAELALDRSRRALALTVTVRVPSSSTKQKEVRSNYNSSRPVQQFYKFGCTSYPSLDSAVHQQ